MGTRSLIKFYEKYGNDEIELVTIYQQYDGYIDGVGHELAGWLKKRIILNGFSGQSDKDGYCNGAGCLVAQFIRDFKSGIGGFYIFPSNSEAQDYNYKVVIDNTKNGTIDEQVQITVTNWDWNDKPIFVGTPSELLAYQALDDY